MKIAIVHEWLVNYAGSEKVLEQIIRLFPEANLYSLFDFLPEGERGFLLNKHVKTSFIQRLPLAKSKYRRYFSLMPLAIKQFDLSGYKIVISSSHSAAKGIRKDSNQVHICYCHTPMRYVWDLQEQYLKEAGWNRGMRGVLVRAVFNRIRRWDISSSKNVDFFLANSNYIKDRIWRAYEREAKVIYPPVDVESFQMNVKKEDFFLTVSRMVPYKRIDLIVEAFAEAGLPLIVIGDGPDFKKVKKKARKNIELMGYLKDDVMRIYMQKARAFVFAAEEDFGIVSVEAQACGTPVIAFGKGGVTETVIPIQSTEHRTLYQERYRGTKSTDKAPTGVFFYEQTPEALIDAVKRFEAVEHRLNPYEIRKNAERFSIERFRKEFKDFVDGKIKEFFK